MTAVAVVATGTANLASVLAALQRLNAVPALVVDPDLIRRADRVVLPGVGAFGAAREALAAHGADEALRERIREGRPLLAVCLGLQLLAHSSEETPGVVGLGLLDADVTRFRGAVAVPQMGWNQVTATAGARVVRDGYAYFANSYKLDTIPDGWEGSTADHGGRFVASVERGDVVACQFHPELSGAWGRDILARWLGAPC